MAGGQRFISDELRKRQHSHLTQEKQGRWKWTAGNKIFAGFRPNFLGFTVALICIHFCDRDDRTVFWANIYMNQTVSKYVSQQQRLHVHKKTIKLGWQGSLLTPFLKKKTFWDHLLCNIGHSDPHLCSRKLIRKFIRFLWNPLPLLQTPQNLIKTKRKKREASYYFTEFPLWYSN